MILKSTDEFLGFLEKGRVSHDFMAAIREVTRHLSDIGEGKGRVKLTVSFDCKGPILTIASDISTTVPKKKRRASAAFLTDQGEISLEHPDQVPLPLGEDRGFARMRRDAETLND